MAGIMKTDKPDLAYMWEKSGHGTVVCVPQQGGYRAPVQFLDGDATLIGTATKDPRRGWSFALDRVYVLPASAFPQRTTQPGWVVAVAGLLWQFDSLKLEEGRRYILRQVATSGGSLIAEYVEEV